MFICSTLFKASYLERLNQGTLDPLPTTTLGQKGRSSIGKKVDVSPKKKFFIYKNKGHI